MVTSHDTFVGVPSHLTQATTTDLTLCLTETVKPCNVTPGSAI